MNSRIIVWIKKIGAAVIIAVLFTILSSCPTPLTKAMTNEVLDSVAPVITVLTPDDGDSYGAYTLITGSVGDKADNSAAGKVVSLFVEILGVTGDQGVPLSDNGSFSVILPTNGAGYSSDIVVKLTATDWNGNSSETTMALRKADGEITGFTVTAGNRSAEIDWNSLPKAASYTLKEFRSGKSVEGITETSYTWGDLSNGNKCSFRVEADIDGLTYCSEIEEAIPLAKSTLVPDVESVYRGINLRWKDIPAASEYVIERSENKDGPYAIWTITPNSYISNTKMKRGEGYFYRVYPVERLTDPNITISTSNYACAGYFHIRNNYPILSSVDTGNSAFYTVLRGNYAYIADGTDGLWIADISDIYNPVIVSYCDTTSADTHGNGNARDVSLSGNGNYAYIANNNSGMEIINISSSSTPYQMHLYSDDTDTYDENYPYDYDTNEALGIDVFDRTINNSLYHYACIGDGSSGIKVINVTHPLNLKQVGYENTTYARRVTVEGDYIYLVNRPYTPNSTSGVTIYKITDQGDPSTLSITYEGICHDSNSNPHDVAISGDYAYVAEIGNGFSIFKISTRSNVGHLSLTNNALGVAVSGTRAYVANGISGLRIIDVGDVDNPTVPSLIATCDTPGDAQAVTINGDYAFVTDYNSGLQIVDISGSPAISKAPASSSMINATGIAVSGNYAFLSDGTDGMKIINISTPLTPGTQVSWSVTGANTTGIAVSGNYAYVTDYLLGLHVIDISNPSAPLLKGTCDIKVSTPGRSMGVAVSGSYAYVAAKDNGLQIVDISDPDKPVRAGLCDMNTDAISVAVSGDYAYVSGGDEGIIIMNISDPDNPYQVSSYNITTTNHHAYGVAVLDSYAYIAYGEDGLYIINVSDPTSPTLEGFYDTSGDARSVTISGSYAFVADGAAGLKVIDISDFTDLTKITSANTTNAKAVSVAGRYAYVADGSGGMKVIDLGDEN